MRKIKEGARRKFRREQGEWTEIRREQGARIPPLGVSLVYFLFGLPENSSFPRKQNDCQKITTKNGNSEGNG